MKNKHPSINSERRYSDSRHSKDGSYNFDIYTCIITNITLCRLMRMSIIE